jgi:hypothetical protein
MEERLIANTVLSLDSFHNGTPCWEWVGTRNTRGYGYCSVRVPGVPHPRKRLAHRQSYRCFKGDIPDGDVIKHLCNNIACISPLHLETGTQSDNMKQCVAEGRHNNFGKPKEQVPDWHREF